MSQSDIPGASEEARLDDITEAMIEEVRREGIRWAIPGVIIASYLDSEVKKLIPSEARAALRSRIRTLIGEARFESRREAALESEISLNGNTRGMSL